MIPERELRRIAAQIGLGVGQAEQEYVLLKSFFGEMS